MQPDPPSGWRSTESLSPPEIATILGISRSSAHRLIDDWAFGDPERLLDIGTGSVRVRRVLTSKVIAYKDRNERQYPPGDPRWERRDAPCGGAR